MFPSGYPPPPASWGVPQECGEIELDQELRLVWARCQSVVALSFWRGQTPLMLDAISLHEVRGDDYETKQLRRQQGVYWVDDRGSLGCWQKMTPCIRPDFRWTATYGEHAAGGGVTISFRVELAVSPDQDQARWTHAHVVCLP